MELKSYRCMQGEIFSADTKESDVFCEDLQKLITEESYSFDIFITLMK